ncbi:MAG TPA: AbrB/MazE/SpoVT family DNA-binding domain-containing protein [Thermoanaerobaculia bacterium]|nr:AbrB/MazE/SpoVT family DNA-binding domain-containing protein [Thermoanaerobaculia bacterium]
MLRSLRWQMTKHLATIGEGGRLVIPAEYRKALGVATGDEVVLILDGENIHISTPSRDPACSRAGPRLHSGGAPARRRVDR